MACCVFLVACADEHSRTSPEPLEGDGSQVEGETDAGLDSDVMQADENADKDAAPEASLTITARDASRAMADASPQLDGCVTAPPPTRTDCQRDSDCSIAFRDGCCGGRYYGIRSDAVAADAPSCSLSCGALGCADIDQAEDQREVWNRALVAVRCNAGACRSYVTDGTFACGASTCQVGQYCYSFAGGVPDSGVSSGCRSLAAGCSGCSCFDAGPRSCFCRTVAGGGVHLECAAP
jgi:hypothetical protein